MLDILEPRPLLAERLIRCQRTRRYWSPEGWTDEPEAATVFGDAYDAVRTCVEEDLKDVELVLQMPDTKAELFVTRLR
ncbi:MAG TPA: hypothetical protein VN673_15925 [Clostridia bacterium]|nr:hypothetical protein [Clostridia bacterium]